MIYKPCCEISIIEHSFLTAESFAFFYTLSQSVCVRLLLIAARVHSLPFEFLFMSSALTGPFPQCLQVWIAQFPSRGNKTLGYPFDFEPLTSWRSYFPPPWHYPRWDARPQLEKVQLLKLWMTRLWEPLLREREGTSVKAACPSGLLLWLFMFLLPRYPWPCHEQRVCFVQNVVPSLPLVAHQEQISPKNSPLLWSHIHLRVMMKDRGRLRNWTQLFICRCNCYSAVILFQFLLFSGKKNIFLCL